MKRIYLLVTAVTLFGAALVSTPALAAFTCGVGYTGPNSQNMCESVEKYQCSVDNENNVKITNSANQTVYSGDAGVEGNGSGGSASSGSVTNNDGTTFTVTITNVDRSDQTPTTCLASVSVPATETPETPAPGKGESQSPVAPTRAAAPQALPVTSGSSAPELMILAGSIALVIFTAAAYRRLYS